MKERGKVRIDEGEVERWCWPERLIGSSDIICQGRVPLTSNTWPWLTSQPLFLSPQVSTRWIGFQNVNILLLCFHFKMHIFHCSVSIWKLQNFYCSSRVEKCGSSQQGQERHQNAHPPSPDLSPRTKSTHCIENYTPNGCAILPVLNSILPSMEKIEKCGASQQGPARHQNAHQLQIRHWE